MPVQITINGADAAESITELSVLAAAIAGRKTEVNVVAPATPVAAPSFQIPTTPPVAQAPITPAAQPQAAAVPTVPAPVPTAPAAAPQAPTTVPTTAPTYTMEQLGVAAGPIVDAGRGPELTAWLQQHGAQALTQLPKEMYGEFATFLRSLGARI